MWGRWRRRGHAIATYTPRETPWPTPRPRRRRTGRANRALLVLIGLVVTTSWNAPTAAAANCQYVLGFATLHDLLPGTVGACLEDEQHNPANGDGVQHTTGGLLVWRKLDNWTAFTNGYETWVNGPYGVQHRLNTQHFAWEGAGSGAGSQLVEAGPEQTLQYYYELINARRYADAYAIWRTPPSTLAQFAAGFQGTTSVAAAVGRPEDNSAAGTSGADIPAVIVATQADGTIRAFAGCYTLVTPNLPPHQPWRIAVADVRATQAIGNVGDAAAQHALATPCPGHSSAA